MGMPTLVILTWMRGWRRAIAVVASVTTVSTTRRGSTASAASWASTATSGSPSLPQTPANVSQWPCTSEGLLKWESVKWKVRSPCPSLQQSSCFSAGQGALWILFVILLAKSSGDICRVKVCRSVPRIPLAWGEGKRDDSFTFSYCYFWRGKAASCFHVLLVWWLLQPQNQVPQPAGVKPINSIAHQFVFAAAAGGHGRTDRNTS